MRLRHFTLVLALALLATFTLRAQNGQNGYWAPTGPTHEKLYVNSGEGDTNNLTIIDVKTMTIIKKMTTGKHPHGVASPKSQDVLYHYSNVRVISASSTHQMRALGSQGLRTGVCSAFRSAL